MCFQKNLAAEYTVMKNSKSPIQKAIYSAPVLKVSATAANWKEDQKVIKEK